MPIAYSFTELWWFEFPYPQFLWRISVPSIATRPCVASFLPGFRMSTLTKMVPQVMLFQKIVSNLGALFSMQTPLGSRTIGPLCFSWTDTTDSGCSPFFSASSGFVSVPCGRLSWFLLAFDYTLIPLLLAYLQWPQLWCMFVCNGA